MKNDDEELDVRQSTNKTVICCIIRRRNTISKMKQKTELVGKFHVCSSTNVFVEIY